MVLFWRFLPLGDTPGESIGLSSEQRTEDTEGYGAVSVSSVTSVARNLFPVCGNTLERLPGPGSVQCARLKPHRQRRRALARALDVNVPVLARGVVKPVHQVQDVVGQLAAGAMAARAA